MSSPFTVLDVSEDATDAVVKKAYLVKVKQHPPDLDPDRFQEIRAAFETVRDERSRVHYRLFHVREPEVAIFAARMFGGGRLTRPATEKVVALLADCIRDHKIITEQKDGG